MQLKRKLADPGLGLSMELCVLPSAAVTQAAAAAGTDMVVIDQEHGAIGIEALHAMIAATAGSGCAPLVRVPEIGGAHVKRALDLGAEGIVFPMVRSVEEARAAIASLRYPPTGTRSWGPFLAHSRWGTAIDEYVPALGDRIVCCLLIETVEAVAEIDAILALEGVDFAVVAQFDLSTSLGRPGDFASPAFVEAVQRIEAAARQTGVPLGIGPVADREHAARLRARGYRILISFDVLRLRTGFTALADWAHADIGGQP